MATLAHTTALERKETPVSTSPKLPIKSDDFSVRLVPVNIARGKEVYTGLAIAPPRRNYSVYGIGPADIDADN
jgi:hypothetical protein